MSARPVNQPLAFGGEGQEVSSVLALKVARREAASQHYRAELDAFFGIDLAQVFPYNLMRTWHVQLAIFWVSTSFLAAGIFLAPMIAGREPQGQSWLAFGLLGALVLVVFGSMAGEFIGIHGWTNQWAGDLWAWFGNQGWEYLDLGRFWKILLSIGETYSYSRRHMVVAGLTGSTNSQ